MNARGRGSTIPGLVRQLAYLAKSIWLWNFQSFVAAS
jgi:hypothetical protein